MSTQLEANCKTCGEAPDRFGTLLHKDWCTETLTGDSYVLEADLEFKVLLDFNKGLKK